MPALAIDQSRTTLVAASATPEPAPAYAELSDGSRRRIPDRQAVDADTQIPVWIVHALLMTLGAGKPEMVRVKVTSPSVPVVPPMFTPVDFVDLVAVPYVDSQSGRVALSFRASGIRASAAGKAA